MAPASEPLASASAFVARVKRAILSPQAGFIATNLASNLSFLARSYVIMLFLPYAALGVVAAMQALFLLVGMLQFGVLNGGYRLLCSADDEEARALNDLAYGCMAIIGVVTLIAVVATREQFLPGLALWVVLAGIFGGVLTLVKTWINNQLIARQWLVDVNRATLWSSALSMLPLLAIGTYPLEASVISLIAQPVIFVVGILWKRPTLRPASLRIDRSRLQQVLGVGFVIFLTSLFTQLNQQVERWYVLNTMGLEALGHLFLALLTVALFNIVPNALLALQMPRLVSTHDSGDLVGTRREMVRLFLTTVGYCAVTAGVAWLLLEPIVALLLPRYLPDLAYVYLTLPGLIAIALASVPAVAFNILVIQRTYLVAFGLGSLATVAVFAAAGQVLPHWSLAEVTIIKSAASGLTALILVLGAIPLIRQFPQFKFWPFALRGKHDRT